MTGPGTEQRHMQATHKARQGSWGNEMPLFRMGHLSRPSVELKVALIAISLRA